MRTFKFKFFTLVLFAIISINNYPQNGKVPYTMDAQLQLNIPSRPKISPDGNNIIFSMVKADTVKSTWINQLYIFNIKKKEYRRFTKQGDNCTQASFSPDGKWVTFVSSRDYFDKAMNRNTAGTNQLWSAPLSGGEGNAWTNLPENIQAYAWSNDSKKIALLTNKHNPRQHDIDESLKKKRLTVTEFPHSNPEKTLYIMDVNSKKILSAFTLDPGATAIRFNSAGDKIIYQTNYTGTDNDAQKYDIKTISFKGREDQLTNQAGPETNPKYSPDDKHIAYITQTLPDVESAENDLNIMAANSKDKVNLTKNFDLSVDYFVWKDPDIIYFTVHERTNNELYSIDIKSKKITKLTEGNRIISNVTFSNQGKEICYLQSDSKSLPELFLNNQRISNFSSQLKKYSIGTQEVLTYKSSDKKFDIDEILFKPYNFDPHKKYPLILLAHGGPYYRFTNSLLQYYGVHEFNNAGYLVLATNPRGSSGYSDAFGEAARFDLGGADYKDIMSGLNNIIAKGFVDTTRMGVTGGSYGGYLTNWIISQNNRFKAAVSMYGIFSYFTDWSNSTQPAFEKMWFGYYYWQKPINMKNLYVSRSPAFYVQNIKTPTLILHGAEDVSTDVSNSREMYQALHTMGVPVKFVIYPRAGHGLKNEPNQYLDTIHRSLDWFKKYLTK